MFSMPRAQWQKQRRADITIIGLEPCLRLLGLDETLASSPTAGASSRSMVTPA